MSFTSVDPIQLLNQAHSHWSAAQAQLSSSIQQYLNACMNLQALAQPSIWNDKSKLEQVFQELGNCVQSTLVNENLLATARQTLNKSRNRSTKLVSINALHPEILTYTFSLAKCHCTRDPDCMAWVPGDDELNPFMNVCTYWRQVALDSPELWAHIDLHPFSSDIASPFFSQYALKQLTRAQGAALHVHIEEEDYLGVDDLRDIMAILAPYKKQIQSFDLDTGHYILRLLQGCFFHSTFPGAVRSLRLSAYRAREPSVQEVLDSTIFANAQPQPEYIESVLASLNKLDIHSAFVLDWTNSAFKGLVDLRLDSLASARGPTVHEIAGVLSSSPQLRILKLSRITIRQTNAYRGPPIKLEFLEKLNLLRLHPRNLPVLLPLLAPGSNGLSLSIRLQGVNRIEPVERFLQNSNVRKICIDVGFDQSEWVPRIFLSVPKLEVLAIRYLSTAIHMSDTIDSSHSVLCPGLKEFYLLSSTVRLLHLSRIFSFAALRRLWTWDVSRDVPHPELFPILEENAQMLRRLPVAIPDYKDIYYLRPNPTSGWDFVC